MGREKSIGRILTNLKNANLIKNIPMRVGRKYEFLYSIKNRDVLPKYLLKICQYFKNKKLIDMQGNLKNKKTRNGQPMKEFLNSEGQIDDLIIIDNDHLNNNNIKTQEEDEEQNLKNNRSFKNKVNNANEANATEIYNADDNANLLSIAQPEFFFERNSQIKEDNAATKETKKSNPKKQRKKKGINNNSNLDQVSEDSDEDSFSEFNPESKFNLNKIPSNSSKIKASKKTKNCGAEGKTKSVEEENLCFQNNKQTVNSQENTNLTYKTKFKYASNSQIININPTEDVEFIDLNKQDFVFILSKIIKDEKYYLIANQYKAELLQKNNFDELNENKKQKRNILLDFFHANSDILNLKSLSFISFNRYLFCLNKLHEFKLLLAINLKHLIINELENKTGYSIDRKTLQKILSNLHKLELIKVMEYELIMKNKIYNYSNNREEIKQSKVIAMQRDIVENDDLFSIIEYLIKPRCQSKSQNSNMPGLSHLQLVKDLKVKSDYYLVEDQLFISEEKNNINNFETIKKRERENFEEMDLELKLKNISEIDFYKKEDANVKTANKTYKSKESRENQIDIENDFNLNQINNNKDLFVHDLISRNLFGQNNSNIKIKSKENTIFKLVGIIERKISKINEVKYKQRFLNNLKKLYFVKKNLKFLFESLDNEANTRNNNEDDEFNIYKPIALNLSKKQEKEIAFNNTNNDSISNSKQDYFLNIFNQSIPKADYDLISTQNIKNNYADDENILNKKQQDINLFKLVENYKTNDIIIPNYLKEKLIKKVNEKRKENYGKKSSAILDREEKLAFPDNKKTSARQLLYSSCLLSEKEIEEEKLNLYYFTTHNFIKDCYKNSNLSLSESEKNLAKKIFFINTNNNKNSETFKLIIRKNALLLIFLRIKRKEAALIARNILN